MLQLKEKENNGVRMEGNHQIINSPKQKQTKTKAKSKSEIEKHNFPQSKTMDQGIGQENPKQKLLREKQGTS